MSICIDIYANAFSINNIDSMNTKMKEQKLNKMQQKHDLNSNVENLFKKINIKPSF